MKFFTLTLAGLLSFGIDRTFAATGDSAEPAVSRSTLEVAPKRSSKPSKVILSLESTAQTGRMGHLKDSAKTPSKGLVLGAKQELSAGYQFQNGWGGFAKFTQTRKYYHDASLDKWSISDTSVSLIHPDLYDDGTFKVGGLFRAYIPQTDRSVKQDVRHYAYYSSLSYKFSDGSEISNKLIPRYFYASYFNPYDPRLYVEDLTRYRRSINSWSRWSIGQWTQIEYHQDTPTGYAMEIIPEIDLFLSSHALVGARLSLPVYARESVYDGPENATFEEARAEILLEVSL